MTQYTFAFEEIGTDDVEAYGGKGAHLGELIRAGVRVPPGFCVISSALFHVIESNDLAGDIAKIAAGLDFEDPNAVESETDRIRDLIKGATVPDDLRQQIVDSHAALMAGDERHVAVRSSVAVKDSTVSSFPGMMDTYHFVLGIDDVLARISECWASVWTGRAAYARFRQEIEHDRSLISPLVQVMVDADAAGVLFTANPITGAEDELVIESNWGIGESVVSGKSMNDFFVLNKSDLSIKQNVIARKNVMFTMDHGKGSGRLELEVPEEKASEPTLSEEQLVELGGVGKKIAEHFGYKADIEWAFQGGTLYILQTRKIRNLQ